jgi:hypothetical protein
VQEGEETGRGREEEEGLQEEAEGGDMKSWYRALVPGAVLTLGLCGIAAASAKADVTIGSDVSGTPPTAGTCFGNATFACVVVPISLPSGAQLTSPCEGTVTRFRINGVPTANTYRLRVVHLSGSTATPVSSSPPASLTADGVNTFPASLPIHTGDQFGLDFNHGTVEFSVRYRQPGTDYFYKNGIPDSGTGASTGTDNFLEYLFNADVACAAPAPPPQGSPSKTPAKKCKKKRVKRKGSAAAKKKGCKGKKKRKKK